ncbi:MAG: AAA family ATPase [Clostridiaceae bacterium]
MSIQKIRVDGFKNILDTTISFEKLVALVGLNNYGKSNILEAIDFAGDFIKATPENKMELMSYTKAIPLNIKTAERNFNFEIEFLSTFKDKEIYINYEIEFEWPKNNKENNKENNELINPQIVKEVLKLKENTKGQKYNLHISRDKDTAFYKSSETGRCDKAINITSDNLIINKLNNFDDLYYLDIINKLNNIKFDENIFLDTNSSFETSPIRFKRHSISGLNKRTGSNIAEIIYNLKIDDIDRYDTLVNSFKDLFPDIEDIEAMSRSFKFKDEPKFEDDAPFVIMDTVYMIRVKESYTNQYMNFDNLSSGTKRIFLLLTSAILADKNNVALIAFEELEDCIHPKLFQQLLIILTEIIDNCKIIITSHSPFLIQYLALKDIYIGIPSKYGVAEFKKIKATKEKTVYRNAENQGSSTGEYIFDLLDNAYDDDDDESNLLSFLE